MILEKLRPSLSSQTLSFCYVTGCVPRLSQPPPLFLFRGSWHKTSRVLAVRKLEWKPGNTEPHLCEYMQPKEYVQECFYCNYHHALLVHRPSNLRAPPSTSHTKLISCPLDGAGQGRVTCVNAVFSMQPRSLHSVVSPHSGFSKDA